MSMTLFMMLAPNCIANTHINVTPLPRLPLIMSCSEAYAIIFVKTQAKRKHYNGPDGKNWRPPL